MSAGLPDNLIKAIDALSQATEMLERAHDFFVEGKDTDIEIDLRSAAEQAAIAFRMINRVLEKDVPPS